MSTSGAPPQGLPRQALVHATARMTRAVLSKISAICASLTISGGAIASVSPVMRMTASGPEKVFLIDAEYVKQMVASVVKDQDLSRYIL